MLEITLFSLISIHALREEGDSTSIAATTRLGDFYPRPPRGGRPSRPRSQPTWAAFLSTPSARRATGVHFYKDDYQFISIHALREEGDPSSAVRFWLQKVFLSTPSTRRATPDSRRAERGLAHFYPRPPRGGRRLAGNKPQKAPQFLSTPSARRAT